MANSLNKITTKSILDATVATADIAADAITGAKIADDAIDSEHITDGSIDEAHIAADQITGAKIADDAVGAEHIEDLDATVKWIDNAAAYWGSGNDLYIKHDGTNNYIDAQSGHLYIQCGGTNDDSNVYITARDGENSIVCHDDGEVVLYHDNTSRFKTTSTGVEIAGGGSDIRFANGNWAGSTNTPKIQAHDNMLFLCGGSSGIMFREDGTNRAKIDGSGHFAPATDNTYDLGTSSLRWKDLYLSGGLHVGGTTSSNELDDYEEGSFTPFIGATTTDPSGITYQHQDGRYTKVGNICHIQVFIDIDAGDFATNGVGDGLIAGLPFSSASTAHRCVGAFSDTVKLIPNNFSSGRNNAMLRMSNNTSNIAVHQYDVDNPTLQTAWGITQMDNGDKFKWMFAGSYRV
tara:strand:- start:962 stop:2176 length:1215 start_codon:yes stop_codon:yes gene_type:complete